MPSGREIWALASRTNKDISDCLRRCESAPFPSTARQEKIRALTTEYSAIWNKAVEAFSGMSRGARTGLDAKEKELQECNGLIEESRSQNQQAAAVFQAEISALRARADEVRAAGQSKEAEDVARRTEAKSREFEVSQGTRQAKLSECQNITLPRLNNELNKERNKFAAEENRLQSAEAPPELLAAELELRGVLDKAGNLERSIKSEVGAEFSQNVQADFASQDKHFEAAAVEHLASAKSMLRVMGLVAVCMLAIIIFLFLRPPSEWSAPAASANGSAVVPVIERLVLVGTGRLALLFFGGWVLKYFSELHRSHAEQAVIYRDRRAALGVAENIIRSVPELEQKQRVLRLVAQGYLNFEQSAFRATRRGRASDGKQDNGDLERDLKVLKSAVETIKPLLDSLGSAAGKVK